MSVRLLYFDELMDLPPMTWLVDGLIPTGGLGLLWGKPGAGKSFVALDLALTIATGFGNWHGHRLTAGRVLYVAAEGHHGLPVRVDAWARANEAPSPRDRFAVADAIDLLHKGTADDLIEEATLRSDEQPVLTVVDTLARCMPGGDENGPKDMSTAIATLDRLRELTGGAVLAVHHPGRSGGNERGHSSLNGALDVSMRLTQRSGGHLELSCVKMKDAPEFASMSLRLEPTGRSCVVRDAAPVASTDVDGYAEKIIDHLRGSNEPQSKSAIYAVVGGNKSATLNLVEQLAANPDMPVTEVDGGPWPQYVYKEPTVPFV